jgi:hypothetical protein
VQQEGVFALYKGLSALLLRDVPGWAVFFATYEILKLKTGIKQSEQ